MGRFRKPTFDPSYRTSHVRNERNLDSVLTGNKLLALGVARTFKSFRRKVTAKFRTGHKSLPTEHRYRSGQTFGRAINSAAQRTVAVSKMFFELLSKTFKARR